MSEYVEYRGSARHDRGVRRSDEAGGNPYGVSALDGGTGPTPQALAAARYQGRRVTEVAGALVHGRPLGAAR